MEDRYLRNLKTLSLDEQDSLKYKKVLVVGAGGLGGDIIDGLARFGVGFIRIVDFDRFDITNLNRQLLCSEKVIGFFKADIAKKHVQNINSSISIEAFFTKINKENISCFFENIDLVIDCTDDIKVKLLLEEWAQKLNTLLISASIGGWYGQIATVFPKHPLLKIIYSNHKIGIEKTLGNPRFTVSFVASMQLCLAIKGLLNKLDFKLGFFYIDLNNFEIQWIDIVI
ncbi:ThiF family adenylyltransferase [Cetobacterium sp. 8H]|uniref:HesA/MoeB/ThiF family protein n=1 Tax=Cetobacterium sp. 8H TaxID=2759681 RepID=UPI00163C91BB|nr:ThiF family adenylyltransferase [Cetobacterium sp. 8H]MBC2850388.1 ThiF family adenylyltransferase [Cetobacterium sp. 8H]